MAEHVSSPRASVIVFFVLLVLLAATVFVADLGVGRAVSALVALAIAVAKAVLIVVFFMNIRFSDTVTRTAAVAGFVGLAILLALMMADYVTRPSNGARQATRAASSVLDIGAKRFSCRMTRSHTFCPCMEPLMENFSAHPPTDQTSIDVLIEHLADNDSTRRQEARQKLAAIGGRAVPSLVESLYDPREHVRWEAAKTLEEIRDPLTAPALVTALEDENEDVRWVAGEALVALKDATLAPLLHALIKHSSSFWLCKGAHHVLHELAKHERRRPLLTPVLAGLESAEPGVSTPPAALTALETWRRSLRDRD